MGLFKMFSSAPAPIEEDVEVVERSAVRASQPQGHVPPTFDAVAVLEAAGVGGEQRARVTKAQELLASLPAETPGELKRSIVEAALKAFDVSIDAIVQAADAELGCFEAFIRDGNAQTERELTEGAEEIERLEAEISAIKKRMQLAEADQEALDAATREQMARVRPVRDFFAARVLPSPDNDVEVDVAADQDEGAPPTIIVDASLKAEAEAVAKGG